MACAAFDRTKTGDQLMMPIKVLCSCGQKYAFDVEPVNGRMPMPVACPVCGADGTAAANEIIARSLPAQPAAARFRGCAPPPLPHRRLPPRPPRRWSSCVQR